MVDMEDVSLVLVRVILRHLFLQLFEDNLIIAVHIVKILQANV